MNGTDQNKRVVQDLIEVVWREGRVERLGEFWTEDCVNHAAPAGEDRGLAALRAYHEGFAPFFSGFSDVRIEVQQQIAEADRVVTQILLTAQHTGVFSGVPPTSGSPSLRYWWRIRRGSCD